MSRKRSRFAFSNVVFVGTTPFSDLTFVSTDLCAHVLSFAYQNTFNMALVSKRFYWIVMSKSYWKNVAHICLRYMIPKAVLPEVNFFHGLSDKDPPHYFLSHFVKGQGKYVVCGDCNIELRSRSGRWMIISWWKLPEQNLPANFFYISIPDPIDVTGRSSLITYFNHPQYRKINATSMGLNEIVITYSEFWNTNHTHIWKGSLNQRILNRDSKLPDNPTPAEPFGEWVIF